MLYISFRSSPHGHLSPATTSTRTPPPGHHSSPSPSPRPHADPGYVAKQQKIALQVITKHSLYLLTSLLCLSTSQQAYAQSFGYFVTTSSNHGNTIMPVLPRFHPDGRLLSPSPWLHHLTTSPVMRLTMGEPEELVLQSRSFFILALNTSDVDWLLCPHHHKIFDLITCNNY